MRRARGVKGAGEGHGQQYVKVVGDIYRGGNFFDERITARTGRAPTSGDCLGPL